jgi:hypothetical protein
VSDDHEQCATCGHVRRVYGRAPDGVLCVTCFRARQRCRRCDGLGVGYRGLCWGCLLADRVESLRARVGPERGIRLAAYLDALAASPNPASTLRWMHTPPYALVEDLVDGRLELSHEAFDQRQGDAGEGSAIAYLRAALVAHGALPARDEIVAAFDRWVGRALGALPDGRDRTTLTAFSTWHVARKLTATTARHDGAPPPSANKHARAQVTQAIALTLWLHGQQLGLADLRQDLLDEWLTAGTATRRAVNQFIQWLARSEPSPPLQIAWPVAVHNPPIASDEERLRALSSVLADRRVDPTVRFAAAAVLLFGQPLTRVAALRRDDVIRTDHSWQLCFGRRPVDVPALLDEVLADLTVAMRTARTAASPTDWLMPGRKHGTHVTPEELRRRLQVLDLPVRPGRRGALLALASELPAAVLAEHFAVHRSRAAQWTRAAGRDYADYVAARTVTGHR